MNNKEDRHEIKMIFNNLSPVSAVSHVVFDCRGDKTSLDPTVQKKENLYSFQHSSK